MNDSDDPFPKKPDLDSLEKHIQLDGREPPPGSKPFSGPAYEEIELPPALRDPVLSSPSPEEPPPPARTVGVVKQFYRDLVGCLTEPRHFFETRYPKVTLAYALTFGIVVTWIAAILDWLTRIIRHETLFDGLMKMREKLHALPFWKSLPDDFWAQRPSTASLFPSWLTELLGIALSPFQSLAGFCLSGVILYLGAYLLIPKKSDVGQDKLDISHLIKMVCFTSTPHLVASILGFLPLGLGAFIAWIYGMALLMIALSTRYRISRLRALGTIALPAIVGMLVLSCMVGVGIALIFGLFSTVFGSH